MVPPPTARPLTMIVLVLLLASMGSRATAIGVNWGTSSSHPLPPAIVLQLLKSNRIPKVRLLDAGPALLGALSGSDVDVTVGIPNAMLRSFNSSIKAAESWVHDNVTRYFSGGRGVRIEYVAVGDESFLLGHDDQFYPFVVGAATNIQAALTKANLGSKVKVVVPCSADSFESESSLPSKGHFRIEVNSTMVQILKFLSEHRSPFFVTISPYQSLLQSKNTTLNFALFKETAQSRKDGQRKYKNSFDLSYDTLVTALYSSGFPNMEIVISQIGWPTDGAAYATSILAEEFMKGLLDHLHSKSGTPLRPQNPPIETYLFSLLDEDQRNISSGNFERHWGLFTFDGQAKYQVYLGQTSKKLTNAQGVEYLPSRWCVVNNNKDMSNATAEALDACSVADCTQLSPNGSCFNLSWPANLSYAFNSFYQQHDQRADSCSFGGVGLITTVDPSTVNCLFTIGLQTSHSDSFAWGFSTQLMNFLLTYILVLLK
ncbi:hypothetical protein SAY87_016339 [Trapa incisa]|uniref:glucan endo-1,3-beta-D-glucosidase n=1 Tax=Trapa incisa TaxID=236973 RepID=A0AAN7LCA7_9MYRT|nr:hypothetical protein SAY87_016339 [Trapa incisa]